MRFSFDIKAGHSASHVIMRAGEIAQNMRLPYVLPHTLFLALFEVAKKEVVEVLQGTGIDCSQYCKKVATEINAIPKKAIVSAPPFHPTLNAVLNKAHEYERPCTIHSLIAALLAADGIKVDGPSCGLQGSRDPLVELEELIGLDAVKMEVRKLVELVNFNEARRKAGLSSDALARHFVFTGNPGTGKTTVARIIAEIYKKLGILKKGHLVEVDRSKLVAGYVGQTAIQTNAVIDAAIDGVLFIDEAYSLATGGRSDYGGEAIATLLKRMEDQRDRLVVIVAGYEDEIGAFVNSNPGLKSRFTKYIRFPDYTADELTLIFKSFCRAQGYECSREVVDAVRRKMLAAAEQGGRVTGNARFARNFFVEVKERMAMRVMSEGLISKRKLKEISVEDIK